MTPLPKARQAARRCATLTLALCETCPGESPQRCCGPEFCGMTEAGLRAVGAPIPDKPGLHGVPFLGSEGCVVPAELRPGCATFVCPERISRDLVHRIDALRRRVFGDEAVKVMTEAAVAYMSEVRS